MPETINIYDDAAEYMWKKGMDNMNLYAMLRNSTPFDQTHTTVDQVAGTDAGGNGFAVGGELLDNVAITTVNYDGDGNTNDAKLDFDNEVATASGGAISGTQTLIIDKSVSPAKLIYHIDHDGTKTADDGTNFEIVPDATDGIHVWTN